MHPKDLSINDFTYDLPDERIARYPLAERDQSKCLILDRQGQISQDIYANMDRHIPSGTLMIFNNTKVVEARLLFKKETGSTVELFCMEPDARYSDITTAMLQRGEVYWKCLVGGAKKWKEGPLVQTIELPDRKLVLSASQVEKRNDYFLIRLEWSDKSRSFAEVLHLAGIIPLPPYLKRDTEQSDKERYQTVYAAYDGSVAAPTAGLHFTQKLLQRLNQKGIREDFVTLHVGAGTFKPVKADKMEDHEMHYEAIDVNKSLIVDIVEHIGGNIIAVGTTSLRTIESLYWLGTKLGENAETDIMPALSQWEAYTLPQNIAPAVAMHNLLDWMEKKKIDRLITRTQIIIAPGYQLRIANAVVTNFHQPRSTLILLVAAVIGDRWRAVYDYALQNGFRFLSYGDGSLLWQQR